MEETDLTNYSEWKVSVPFSGPVAANCASLLPFLSINAMLRKGGFSPSGSLTFRFEDHLDRSLHIGKFKT